MATVKQTDPLTLRMTRKAIRESICIIRDTDTELEALQAKLTPLEARKKELAEERESRRREILDAMQELKLDAMEFANIPDVATAKVSVIPGKPKVEVVDVRLVPKKFLNDPTVKKTKVMEVWAQTQEDVPGCEIVVGDRSIRIDYSAE